MPYLTTRKNLKLQLSPGLVASYDIQPGNGVGLYWDTKNTHIYLLTYLFSPDPHGQHMESEAWSVNCDGCDSVGLLLSWCFLPESSHTGPCMSPALMRFSKLHVYATALTHTHGKSCMMVTDY